MGHYNNIATDITKATITALVGIFIIVLLIITMFKMF